MLALVVGEGVYPVAFAAISAVGVVLFNFAVSYGTSLSP